MQIASQAPCRVDLAGGTLDIWPLYLFHRQSLTVNFAVDRYASCVVTSRHDDRIVFASKDLDTREEFSSLAAMNDALHGAEPARLPLLAHALSFFDPPRGVEIATDSQAPAGAGISGSSALLIALCSALNRLTHRGYRLSRLREIAQNLEARVIRVPTGSQDYYPALYGGVSAIEFHPDGIRRSALPVDPAELNARFVLVYTGVPRNSGINNWDVMKAYIDGDARVQSNFNLIAGIANEMRTALINQDWTETARLLREEWSHRRENVPAISTELIDHLIAVTSRAGSTGAKVCGAGGGGCVLFLVEPEARARVIDLITREGGIVLPARLAPRGVRTVIRSKER